MESLGKVLIDGDIIAYRAGFSSNNLEASDAESKVDELIDKIIS